jgi:hypothetical protein
MTSIISDGNEIDASGEHVADVAVTTRVDRQVIAYTDFAKPILHTLADSPRRIWMVSLRQK